MHSRCSRSCSSSNGDIVLRDPDDGAEPLLRIQFSRRVRSLLGDGAMQVGETMIEAAAAKMSAIAKADGRKVVHARRSRFNASTCVQLRSVAADHADAQAFDRETVHAESTSIGA